MECQDELDEMFEEMVQYMYEHLEHFEEILMIDGKAIDSFVQKSVKIRKVADVGNMMLTGAGNNIPVVVRMEKVL